MNVCRSFFCCVGVALYARAQYTISLPDSLVEPGTVVEVIADDRSFCEGPAIAPDGTVYFTELGVTPTRITRIPPGGEPQVFINGSGGANGMVFSPKGYLVACVTGDLVAIDTATGAMTTMVTDRKGLTLGSCNDLTLSSAGEVFFTDPIFGGGSVGNNIYHLSVDGVLSRVARNLKQPNGLVLKEETRQLYVNIAGENKIVRYSAALDGTLSDSTVFVGSVDNPDGIELDLGGNLYVAEYATGRIRVFNVRGEDLGFINVRDGTNFNQHNSNVTNCSFGWGDDTYLYITGNRKVFRVRMKVRGRKGNAVPGAGLRPGVRPRSSSISDNTHWNLVTTVDRKPSLSHRFLLSGRAVSKESTLPASISAREDQRRSPH